MNLQSQQNLINVFLYLTRRYKILSLRNNTFHTILQNENFYNAFKLHYSLMRHTH